MGSPSGTHLQRLPYSVCTQKCSQDVCYLLEVMIITLCCNVIVYSLVFRSPICVDIIGCRGDHVRHALRVKCYPYPEDVCAVWVMFAVKYRSIL